MSIDSQSGVQMAKGPNRLKSLRLQAGLSQNQLARAAGVDRQTISNVERGLNVADLTAAKVKSALSKVLGRDIALSEIFTNKDKDDV